jgi:hypothetical protein
MAPEVARLRTGEDIREDGVVAATSIFNWVENQSLYTLMHALMTDFQLKGPFWSREPRPFTAPNRDSQSMALEWLPASVAVYSDDVAVLVASEIDLIQRRATSRGQILTYRVRHGTQRTSALVVVDMLWNIGVPPATDPLALEFTFPPEYPNRAPWVMRLVGSLRKGPDLEGAMVKVESFFDWSANLCFSALRVRGDRALRGIARPPEQGWTGRMMEGVPERQF